MNLPSKKLQINPLKRVEKPLIEARIPSNGYREILQTLLKAPHITSFLDNEYD